MLENNAEIIETAETDLVKDTVDTAVETAEATKPVNDTVAMPSTKELVVDAIVVTAVEVVVAAAVSNLVLFGLRKASEAITRRKLKKVQRGTVRDLYKNEDAGTIHLDTAEETETETIVDD